MKKNKKKSSGPHISVPDLDLRERLGTLRNLPEFFRNLSKPQILIICIKVSPALVLIKGKIINTKGKENINLPA